MCNSAMCGILGIPVLPPRNLRPTTPISLCWFTKHSQQELSLFHWGSSKVSTKMFVIPSHQPYAKPPTSWVYGLTIQGSPDRQLVKLGNQCPLHTGSQVPYFTLRGFDFNLVGACTQEQARENTACSSQNRCHVSRESSSQTGHGLHGYTMGFQPSR